MQKDPFGLSLSKLPQPLSQEPCAPIILSLSKNRLRANGNEGF